jgi:hypothetical protein
LATLPPSDTPPAKPGSRDEAAQDGFLREVDEALREEQMVTAFKRYAKPVGAVIVIGLLALAGYLWWDNAQKAEAAQKSERMIVAMERIEAGSIEAGMKDLQLLAKDASPGTRAVALMELAGIAAKSGNTPDAIKRFAAIAADASLPQAFRDLATVREVALRFDTMKPEDVVARLQPLAVPESAFFGSAGELVGMAYLEMGKPQEAGKLFAKIGQDKNVPKSLRSRMRQLAGGLGFDAGLDEPELESTGDGEAAAAASDAPKP